ncbi:MAG: hypothetical protein O7D86_10120 [Proteobacteria bacterium]|nr:hypothetical protein [Pseudomonadota bacterium]
MLRKKLDEITREVDVSKHEQLLRDLSKEIENTIQVLISPHQVSRYTCIVYIFDFVEDEYYESIVTRDIFSSPDFVTF